MRKVMSGLACPSRLRDRDDIHARIDQLAGMGVPQRVERHIRHADALREIAPGRADGIWRERGAVEVREQQRIVRQLPAQAASVIRAGLAVLPQRVDQDIGQRDVAATGL